MLTWPPPSPPLARVALCVTGQLRSGSCERRATAAAVNNGRNDSTSRLTPTQSIRAHLIEPLREHGVQVDVFAVLDAPPTRGQRLPGVAGPLMQRALNALGPVQWIMHGESDDAAAWLHARGFNVGDDGAGARLLRNASPSCASLHARFEALLGGSGAVGGHSKTGSGANHFVQARKLQSCWRMLEAREVIAGQRYTHVVRARPDLFFHRRLDLRPYFDPGPGGVARGQPAREVAQEDLCVQPIAMPISGSMHASMPHPPSHCYASCGDAADAAHDASTAARPDRRPLIVQSAPFPANLPNFYVHDQFYVADRHAARGMFDHLTLFFDDAVAPFAREVQLASQPGLHGDLRGSERLSHFCDEYTKASHAHPQLLPPCEPYARQLLARMRAASPDLPASNSALPLEAAVAAAAAGVGPDACRSIKPHECAVVLGMAHHQVTCCTSYRVSFLLRKDVPQLLRLGDTDEACDVAREVYACSERMVTLRPKDTPEVREAKKARLAACAEAGQQRWFAG